MVLKHRDTEVLRFEWLDPEGVRILSVNEKAKRFLSLDMYGEATDEGLRRRLRHRAVPKRRAHVEQFLAGLGSRNGDVRSVVGFFRGLSLNDVHRVVEDGDRFRTSLRVLCVSGGRGAGTRSRDLRAVEVQGASPLDCVLHCKPNGDSTMDELSILSGVSRRTVSNEIKRLREAGEIRRVGSDRTGHRETVSRQNMNLPQETK